MIFRSGDADTSFSRVMLDDMVTDLVHEHVEEHEGTECPVRPANDSLRTSRNAFDCRPGASQARFGIFR